MITIIVMLILAGVSLNAIIGDNGIITNAQDASFKSGMAALEEWLQGKYVEYYSEAYTATNKPEFLASKIDDLFLKEDISRNYVINGGRIYYLLNKQCSQIPDGIRSGLRGGDTTDINGFRRLIDVYGVTKDLKLFYIDTNSETTYGNVENYKIDPTLKSTKSLSNHDVATQLSNALNAAGFSSTPDNITLGQISTLSNFTLNGSEIENLTDLTGISDATSLETLTLENLNLSSMNGLERLTKVYYLYLRNVTCEDYSALCNLWDLTHLYIYMPSATMDETTCNAQVINLGEGLADASKLTKLKNFGISGVEDLFNVSSLKFEAVSHGSVGSILSSYPISAWAADSWSNLTNLGTLDTGLGKFNSVVKNNLAHLLLNNNSFSNIASLKDFEGIYQLHLMGNKNLYDISGISNHTSIVYLTLQKCSLGSLDTDSVIPEYRAFGLTRLQYLSVARNSKLTSLLGLEQSSNLKTLLAYGCNLKDITALGTYTYKTDEETGELTTTINKITNPHKNLSFLNLRSNLNLISVDSLGGLTGLSELYLLDCSSLEYDSSYININKGIGKLNNSYIDDKGNSKVLFLQLSNSYNGLEDKYKPLFDNLLATQSKEIDFSTDKLKNSDGTPKVLVNSDPLINAIKSRTDIELLNLGGQVELEPSTINTIIESNKNSLKYLGLKDLTQIEHFGDYEGEDEEWSTYRSALKVARAANPPLEDPVEPNSEGKEFIKSLPALDNCTKLSEIDICGTNTHASMRQITEKMPRLLIILNNTNINVNELGYYLTHEDKVFSDILYGDSVKYSNHSGNIVFGAVEDDSIFDFTNWGYNTFVICNDCFLQDFGWYTGGLDLSMTTITSANIRCRKIGQIKFPKSLLSYRASRGSVSDDFSSCSELLTYYDSVTSGFGWTSISTKARLSTLRLSYGRVDLNLSLCKGLTSETNVYIDTGSADGFYKYYAADCSSLSIVSKEEKPAKFFNTNLLKSTETIILKNISFGDSNPIFYTCCDSLTLTNTDLSELVFQKEVSDAVANSIEIILKDNSNLTSIAELPDNLNITSLDISNCPISGDYMETLCSRFYRDGDLIISNFSLKSDSLASSATVGTQWVKPLLELHEAGLTSIKIGGKYVDNQAIDWLKNGVEIDGVEFEGFGTSNVTIYN